MLWLCAIFLRTGARSAQCGSARGQRVWKRQLVGGAARWEPHR
jgi:hypothetical protein